VRVQETFPNNPRALLPDRKRWIVKEGREVWELETVAADQALRRWKAVEGRAHSVAWIEEIMQGRRVIAGRQAAKPCPLHNPHGKPAAVPAVVAVVAAAEEDKEERICAHTQEEKESCY
jgi:uncharacterized protein YccT (UPF0319 family)